MLVGLLAATGLTACSGGEDIDWQPASGGPELLTFEPDEEFSLEISGVLTMEEDCMVLLTGADQQRRLIAFPTGSELVTDPDSGGLAVRISPDQVLTDGATLAIVGAWNSGRFSEQTERCGMEPTSGTALVQSVTSD